jgi:hypothetical protein
MYWGDWNKQGTSANHRIFSAKKSLFRQILLILALFPIFCHPSPPHFISTLPAYFILHRMLESTDVL